MEPHDIVGVVGVRLNSEQTNLRHFPQIPSYGRGTRIEDGGQGCVPDRALGSHGFVGQQGKLATDVLPRNRRLVRQQVSRRTSGLG
jgi:hypothetical protein